MEQKELAAAAARQSVDGFKYVWAVGGLSLWTWHAAHSRVWLLEGLAAAAQHTSLTVSVIWPLLAVPCQAPQELLVC